MAPAAKGPVEICQKSCLTVLAGLVIVNKLDLRATYFGWVAQLVEQGTENPRVRGSIPFPATRKNGR